MAWYEDSINIMYKRYNTGFTFPIYCSATWSNNNESGYGDIECIVTIFLKEDIDGEGWICAVANNDIQDVKKNKGFNFKLLGVNCILDKVIIDYTIYSSYKTEHWVKTYNNCISLVSRADLNYSNLEQAIFKADYGNGDFIDINLSFEYDDNMLVNFTQYQVNNQREDFTDPETWTLSNLKSKTESLQRVVHDIKKEIVTESGGVSNGYIGLADIAKKAQKFYIGINDKAKEITKIYIGDKNGKAKMFYSSDGGVLDISKDLFVIWSETNNTIIINNYARYKWIDYENEYYDQHIYIPHLLDNKLVYIKN